MKRLIMFTFVALLALALSSTSIFASGLKVGLKGGVNFAKLTEPDIIAEYESLKNFEEYKIGLIGGGFLSLELSDSVAIQPEVLFTTKGAQYEETVQDESIKFKTKLDYLEIPLLLKLSMPPQGQAKIMVFGGPAIAINLTAKSKLEVLDEIRDIDVENIKKNDYGVVVGAGFDFGGFIIEGRYTIGLTPIDEDEISDMKNQVISFMAGIYF